MCVWLLEYISESRITKTLSETKGLEYIRLLMVLKMIRSNNDSDTKLTSK